jgi:hypothetical protein
MVKVTLAPLIRFSLSLAWDSPGVRPVTVPATAAPPEYLRKSRRVIPITHLLKLMIIKLIANGDGENMYSGLKLLHSYNGDVSIEKNI